MKKLFAIFTVLAVVYAAPQLENYKSISEDNDVAIDFSSDVIAVPEEKIGYISEDVPANILSNRQRRDISELNEGSDITTLFDVEGFQDEDPHLSASPPSLPLAPDTPSADIPIGSPSELFIDSDIPPEEPEDYENSYLPPEESPAYIPREESSAYIPPEEPSAYIPPKEPSPAHVFTEDGYKYRTVKRVQYRYRHRN